MAMHCSRSLHIIPVPPCACCPSHDQNTTTAVGDHYSRSVTIAACYAQNLNPLSTSMAQWNLFSKLLLNTFSMGTSLRLHQAMVMRGSM